ncbi:FAD binding domain-containing protein [Streptomyces enissocaesilis]|uniref:FAD binding domain-containing protein n=1 Tax=Streptomyces enissocaesilis TaxID=332589 RepID=UPI0031D95219
MDLLRPATWAEAPDAKAQHPDATPIAGGTDVMAGINAADRRPAAPPDLTGAGELAEGPGADGRLRTGAGVSCARNIDELGARLPGPAVASRTVGSPRTGNRGTLGGHPATAPPAGDGHPPLVSSDAEIGVSPLRGSRMTPVGESSTGVKRTALAEDELISRGCHRPR